MPGARRAPGIPRLADAGHGGHRRDHQLVASDLASASDCKTVFVLASFDPQRSLRERQVVRWLKRIAKFGVEIGGIENGSLLLAEAGLLFCRGAAALSSCRTSRPPSRSTTS